MKPSPLFVLALAMGSALAEAPIPRDGLLLEFDAARQVQLRQAAQLPSLGEGSPVDRWLNAAPSGPTALQPMAANRPVFRTGTSEAFVRFDGKDDALVVLGQRRRIRELTLFVIAAPHGNPGSFTGVFATAAAGQNDYTSGMNLDQGPSPSADLSVLNVESAGSGGFRNLLPSDGSRGPALPFGVFHVFTVRSRVGTRGNELFLDGQRLGTRPRAESVLGIDDMVLGGRLYSNDPAEPPHAQGSFHGDLAVVLLYERALTDAERTEVEQSLLARTAALNTLASGQTGHALSTLTDAPAVQLLVPGFAVEELPLRLRNLNGIRYRHDGVLVALGYDGRVHLVTDSDGDGREDRSTIFWDKSPLRGPIGMALLPQGDPRGEGVYVASKGKVSLLLDRDRDGQADEEVIVASGWTEIAQSVDAIGLAVDPRDGSIFFGLGTEDYANAFLIDPATGRSRFNLRTEHGTIQRVSPDFSKRETYCTGTRFTCALAFNRAGDLFASEQEGATWLPNGNPLDELLHVRPGLHYGFPPRHPRHLPQVVDEPAVFEYAPQHQSTVGMIFNEGVNGGPHFGPAAWAGDAILCGESRGKLYRTQLIKTPNGYVARNHLVACLGFLAIDACVTPAGDLLVACHSGPPDWGTGPTGEGKIFRIRYAAPTLPQPVLAWAAAPDEFRVAFDRSLRDADWTGAREKVRVEAGRHVSAGDRFEVIRPGYQVVRDQMTARRRWVDVHSLSLSADRRTLILRVPRQTEPVTYAVTLPTPDSWRVSGSIAQKPEIDLALSLDGLQATLTTADTTNRVILPHPTPAVARAFTAGSAEHEAFFQRWDQAGSAATVTWRGQVKLGNIFVPAVQPGSSLDWDLATDAFAQRQMTVRQDFGNGSPSEVALPATGKPPVGLLELTVPGRLVPEAPGLAFALDDQVRPIALNRLQLPWVTNTPPPENAAPIARTDVKGNWLHGRRVFFGDGGCVTCHTLRGEGMPLGPDLSNLVHRDRESVWLDITRPSATINPDHLGSTVRFTDGNELKGIVRTLDAERIVLRLPANAQLERPRRDVASIEPLAVSLMTENLGQTLDAEAVEDLLTFLLTNPLEPARITRLDPPLPTARTQSEVAEWVTRGPLPAASPSPLRILLVIDDKDHGLDEHDYPVWQERWARLLALADGVRVTTARGFPTRDQLAAADVTVFYSRNAGWNPQAATLLDDYQQRGGGLVYLHWAMEGGREAVALAERIGLATGGSKYRHGELELHFTQPQHPVTRGFERLHLVDESYWAFHGNPTRLTELATSIEDGEPRTQLWAFERGKGRVFGSIPGHYTWTFDDPLYRVIVLRGIAWAAWQENVDRLVELAPVGARLGRITE